MVSDGVQLPVKVSSCVKGEWVEVAGARQAQRENPAQPEQIVSVTSVADEGVVNSAVAAARQVFDEDVRGWVTSPKQREQVLLKTANLMRANAARLAQLVSLEVGMPIRQAGPHVAAAADIFEFYAGYATKLYGECLWLPNGSNVQLHREPVGVVGMILPWNFPLTQAARKIAPALAVGCTTVLKPASFTPAVTAELVRLMHEAGAPAGVVNLVAGGPPVGAAMVNHPHVDKLSFTGSTPVGIGVQQQAAATLKRVSLELGGKNPFILMEDANLDAAARSLLFGMFRNAGQACGSTSRLLVHKQVHQAFLSRFVELVKGLRVGLPQDPTTDVGPMISRKQQESVLAYIEGAQKEGARLLTGGHRVEGQSGWYVEPTVFDEVDPGCALAREEVFGPVLAVMTFEDEAQAIRMANDSPFGLTASLFSGDHVRAMRMSRKIQAGTVWLGDAYTQPVEGIWGGYKQSGLGRELGPYGLLDFVEIKQIYTDGTGTVMKPHYGQVMKA